MIPGLGIILGGVTALTETKIGRLIAMVKYDGDKKWHTSNGVTYN